MILIGTMNLTRTQDRGEFYCPTCRAQQTYRFRARRPFLTIYFIPTVPVGAAESFVQCDACKENFDGSVLELDRASHEAAQEEQFRDEAIRSAVLITLEDDVISEAEIDALLRISDVLFDRQIDREELGRLCSIANDIKIQTDNYVLTVSRRWNMQQRLLALQGMFLAATAGEDDLTPSKLKMLKAMQELLELTDEEFEATIDDALNYEAV